MSRQENRVECTIGSARSVNPARIPAGCHLEEPSCARNRALSLVLSRLPCIRTGSVVIAPWSVAASLERSAARDPPAFDRDLPDELALASAASSGRQAALRPRVGRPDSPYRRLPVWTGYPQQVSPSHRSMVRSASSLLLRGKMRRRFSSWRRAPTLTAAWASAKPRDAPPVTVKATVGWFSASATPPPLPRGARPTR